MAIEVIGTIKPKNGAKFPIVEDMDISVKLTKNTAFDFTLVNGTNTRYSQFVERFSKPNDGGNYWINKIGSKAAAGVTVRFILFEMTQNEDNTAVLKQVAVLGDAVADSDTEVATLEFDGGYMIEQDHAVVLACAESCVIQVVANNGLVFPNVFTFEDANYFGSQNGTEISGFISDDTSAGTSLSLVLVDYDLINAMTLSEYVNRSGGGASGKSAYDVAVDNGFQGSEEEWLASLKGEPGDQGDPGKPGKSPVKGEDYFTDADKQEMVEAVLDAMPEDPVATNVDLSAYESRGIINETFGDGTIKTTTVEFDADGNPVKITDGDGNITTLTW